MKFIIIILNLMFVSGLFSTTWVINQDGSGHFTFISVGIMVAQDGDTLLVHPGVYYENINYQGKNITITSLYDGDQYDESYIAATIIDGNQEDSVVTFNSNETGSAVLHGFTIRNGLAGGVLTPASVGGGIFITNNAAPTISHCYIRDNTATWGGGIFVFNNGSAFLTGNRIFNNHSLLGGAVRNNLNTSIEFCTESLNSVYLNYSARGADLYLGGRFQEPIVVDTLSVLNPDNQFVVIHSNVPEGFTITINHGKIEPVPADFYVAPDGCDSNSGLSPDDPFRTIAWAMMKIAPDSLQQRTIYLAEGIYSHSMNGQYFPVGIRSFVDIIGANRETTILDLEGRSNGFHSHTRPSLSSPAEEGFSFDRNYTVKNLSLTNGSGTTLLASTLVTYFNSDFTLENIDIFNVNSNKSFTVRIWHSYNMVLRNIHIYDTSGDKALGISSAFDVPVELYAENIRIRNNVPGPYDPNYAGTGGGMKLDTGGDVNQPPLPLNATIVNLEITDCVIDNWNPIWGGIPIGQFKLISPSGGDVKLVNATIGNNWSSLHTDAGLYFVGSANYELYNSIVYGNIPHEIGIINIYPETGNLYISHSLIGGGQDGFYYIKEPNFIVHWGEGNLDADPLWIGEANPDYPYMLSENSPARNAGTLDIPGFEFPEYDLAGNPRIYGESIDMGAYEWNPVSVEENDKPLADLSVHDYRLYNYPNPVVGMQGMGAGRGVGTTISFVMPQEGEAVIDIYNLKGQFVKRVFNAKAPAGEYEVLWNGTDEQGRIVATGFYMYRLMINGKQVAAGRCTFVK